MRSTTLVFKVLCTLVQIFGVIQFQTGAQQNKIWLVALCVATSRHDAEPAPTCRSPRRPRPRRPSGLGTQLQAPKPFRGVLCYVRVYL
jgi:hypothetical protein